MTMIKDKRGEIRVDITEHMRGKEPTTTSKGAPLPAVQGKHIAMVSYRVGTKMTENYHSITCEVEIQLPVALDYPSGDKRFDPEPVEEGFKEAVRIAETAYEREAKGLRKLLHRMASNG